MTTPEQSEQLDSDGRIWELVLRELVEIPRRYQLAQVNQQYSVAIIDMLDGRQPLGFEGDRIHSLSADAILQQNIGFVNSYLSALRGKLLYPTSLLPEAQQQQTTEAFDLVSAVVAYRPEDERWKLKLESGHEPSMSVEQMRDLLEYKP